MSAASDPVQAASPAPPDPDRAARNAANGRNRRRAAFIKRAVELGQAETEDEALLAFNDSEIAREAYIATMMAQHPAWDRSRAASGWLPHGKLPRSGLHNYGRPVTEDDGWTIDHRSWNFQRSLWKRDGIVLCFGEYRRLVKQASVMEGTPEERRANYKRRVERVKLDNGKSIVIDIIADRIFGFGFINKWQSKTATLAQSLHEKYGLPLGPTDYTDIQRQVDAQGNAPAVPLRHNRGIYRVALGGNPEVYVMAVQGRVTEAKRAEGVRRALAKQDAPVLSKQPEAEPA